MAELIVTDLTAEQAIALWPQISALLEPLLAEDGLYVATDILAEHLKGEKKIWVAWHGKVLAVFVTQIVTYPRKRVLGIPYIAGSQMELWKDKFIEVSEAYAKAMGCHRIAGSQREGWVRVAGYQKHGVVLVKELT